MVLYIFDTTVCLYLEENVIQKSKGKYYKNSDGSDGLFCIKLYNAFQSGALHWGIFCYLSVTPSPAVYGGGCELGQSLAFVRDGILFPAAPCSQI